ncbi:site-specific DNA-methyltransferase [Luteimonas sp. A534]
MPVLDWIGKAAVVKHHKDVPYRLLEVVPGLSCGDADSGNLVVQGDNLHALKALLPRYAGQVKCIYIDPPYNTGNEGWTYNDNVNSPEIAAWLGKTVGPEAEDLSRHDKWLCMMYPRLALLKQFLRDDGVLFCSIGEDEVGHLRVLLDEIFGTKCHIETFIFVTEGNTENAEDVTAVHDYVLAYARRPDAPRINPTVDPSVDEGSKLLRDFAENSIIKNGSANPASAIELPIGFPCEVDTLDIPASTSAEEFIHATNENNGWIARTFKSRFQASYPIRLDRMLVRNHALVQPCRVYSGWSSANKLRRFISTGCDPIDDDGARLRFFLSKNGVPTYRREGRQAHFVSTLLRNLGSTEKDKNELERMGLKFDYPKPRKLIAYLVSLYVTSGDLVMDVFGGSGTTGHAVLASGVEGLRFIIVEMDETNATQVIAPRLRKVIEGYEVRRGKKNLKIDGLGGDFQFFRLSREPLFTPDGQVRDDVRFAQLAEFVWFSETGTGLKSRSKSPLLGVHQGRAIYLLYNGILGDQSVDGGNVLTSQVLDILDPHDGPRVIYAAACRLGTPRLKREGIVFKQTPYSLDVAP